MKHKD